MLQIQSADVDESHQITAEQQRRVIGVVLYSYVVAQ